VRLIDDCFFLLTYGVDELQVFINLLNNCHCSIKFEAIFSTEKGNFLDTVTCIVDDVIHTILYIQPILIGSNIFSRSTVVILGTPLEPFLILRLLDTDVY